MGVCHLKLGFRSLSMAQCNSKKDYDVSCITDDTIEASFLYNAVRVLTPLPCKALLARQILTSNRHPRMVLCVLSIHSSSCLPPNVQRCWASYTWAFASNLSSSIVVLSASPIFLSMTVLRSEFPLNLCPRQFFLSLFLSLSVSICLCLSLFLSLFLYVCLCLAVSVC